MKKIYSEIGSRIRKRPTFKCGDGYPTLLIGGVGTAQESDSLEQEVAKAKRAVAIGAHVIADNSFYGDISEYHKALTDNVDAYIATVANYEFAAKCRQVNLSMNDVGDHFALDVLSEQAERGLDIISVHASFLLRHLPMVLSSKRLIPTTSKGGGVISSYLRSGRENPYYVYFDEILDIFKHYNTTLSLGSVFRPATVCDCFDVLLIEELTVMGELVLRAQNAGVPVMVEGIGHSTIGNIPTHIRLAKTLCHNAPYRMLPMATDIALGYDHISAAIAGAVGVASGANVITCVSRAEHLGLPREKDVEEAIIAGKIAVHCGELSDPTANFDRDRQMSTTRWHHGCKGDWTAAIFPEGALLALEDHNRLDDQAIKCSMCGKYCGIAAANEATRLN